MSLTRASVIALSNAFHPNPTCVGRERFESIKRQIEAGTFSFAEEFPDFRFLGRPAPRRFECARR
jgi:hypothetical protein